MERITLQELINFKFANMMSTSDKTCLTAEKYQRSFLVRDIKPLISDSFVVDYDQFTRIYLFEISHLIAQASWVNDEDFTRTLIAANPDLPISFINESTDAKTDKLFDYMLANKWTARSASMYLKSFLTWDQIKRIDLYLHLVKLDCGYYLVLPVLHENKPYWADNSAVIKESRYFSEPLLYKLWRERE